MPSLPKFPGSGLVTDTTKRARFLAVGAVATGSFLVKKALSRGGDSSVEADPIAETPTAPPGAEDKPVPASDSVPEPDPGRPGAIPYPVDAEAAPAAADSSVDAKPRKAKPAKPKKATPAQAKSSKAAKAPGPDPEKPGAIPYPVDAGTAASGKAEKPKAAKSKAAKPKAPAKPAAPKPGKAKAPATKAADPKPAEAKPKAPAKPAETEAPAAKPADPKPKADKGKAKAAKPKAAKAKKPAPKPPKNEPGNISVDKEHPHRALNNPVGDPDETEYPDPFEKRPDPRDPADPDGKPFGEEPHPQTGSESTSEPPLSQDPAVSDGGKPPRREKLDD